MAKLVEVCESLGYEDVWTHANSGNVVFDATGSRLAIERAMTGALEAAFGFEVTTFLRSAADSQGARRAPIPSGGRRHVLPRSCDHGRQPPRSAPSRLPRTTTTRSS